MNNANSQDIRKTEKKLPKMITISKDTLTSVNIHLADKQGISFSQMVEDALLEKIARDTEVKNG